MMMAIWKISHKCDEWGIPLIPRICYVFNRIFFSAVIPPSVKLGTGVHLGYRGLGIIIHRRAVIGNNVLIGAHVTIGGRSSHHNVPIIEDDVVIGNGAKVLGPITIGRGAQIGANAVVITDIPPGALAVGVPARIIERGNEKI